ncbi:MAG: hypothetical protein JO186_10450 [Actinobacteria bacterium]|nr:hypothetical protein [Actinomycetota bacterium]MBV8396221.1 hypothetical protein [Actinomycetota bacterium]
MAVLGLAVTLCAVLQARALVIGLVVGGTWLVLALGEWLAVRRELR